MLESPRNDEASLPHTGPTQLKLIADAVSAHADARRDLQDVCAEFTPITLDALVREAELLKRVDRKYLVPLEVASRVVAGLDPRTRVLEINGAHDFAYDSVYFDTEDHLSYRLTAQRRRRRFKLRTRSYLDTGGCFLEVKTKSGRGATVKQRIPYDAADRAHLSSEGRSYAREVLAEQGHSAEVVHELRPVLTSRYRRTTLLLPEGSRATIDTELRWGKGVPREGGEGNEGSEGNETGPGENIALTGFAIVETKSVGKVSELDHALWRAGHRPSRISKFGTGTAALHPELPSNKWTRQLRGPFCHSKIHISHI